MVKRTEINLMHEQLETLSKNYNVLQLATSGCTLVQLDAIWYELEQVGASGCNWVQVGAGW